MAPQNTQMNANGKEFLLNLAKLSECDTSSCRFGSNAALDEKRCEDAPHSKGASCESLFRFVSIRVDSWATEFPQSSMRHKHSDYMHWSKTQSRARFNLATSGVAPFPFHELPIDLKELEINGDDSYGYAPLQQAIAAFHGIDPDCVVESAGTSMANHLAMAAIIEPGDEVLIEHPAYRSDSRHCAISSSKRETLRAR